MALDTDLDRVGYFAGHTGERQTFCKLRQSVRVAQAFTVRPWALSAELLEQLGKGGAVGITDLFGDLLQRCRAAQGALRGAYAESTTSRLGRMGSSERMRSS